MKDNFVDIFGKNPSTNGTMQVIVFDKFFKCLYRLKNVPKDWHFDKVAEQLGLTHKPNEYQAIRLDNSSEFCSDEFVYKDGKLTLTSSNCV